jgi:hypothetical protein
MDRMGSDEMDFIKWFNGKPFIPNGRWRLVDMESHEF